MEIVNKIVNKIVMTQFFQTVLENTEIKKYFPSVVLPKLWKDGKDLYEKIRNTSIDMFGEDMFLRIKTTSNGSLDINSPTNASCYLVVAINDEGKATTVVFSPSDKMKATTEQKGPPPQMAPSAAMRPTGALFVPVEDDDKDPQGPPLPFVPRMLVLSPKDAVKPKPKGKKSKAFDWSNIYDAIKDQRKFNKVFKHLQEEVPKDGDEVTTIVDALTKAGDVFGAIITFNNITMIWKSDHLTEGKLFGLKPGHEQMNCFDAGFDCKVDYLAVIENVQSGYTQATPDLLEPFTRVTKRDAQKQISDLQSELAAAQAEISRLRSENSKIARQLAATPAAAPDAKLQADLESAHRAIHETEERAKKVEVALTTTTQDLQQTETELQQAHSDLQDRENELQQAVTELQAKTQDLKLAESEKASLQRKIDTLQQKIIDLETEKKTALQTSLQTAQLQTVAVATGSAPDPQIARQLVELDEKRKALKDMLFAMAKMV